MRKGQHAISAALLFLALSLSSAGAAGAESAGPSAESKACLSCHARHGLVATFENDEFIEAYVDAEKYGVSVHNSLSCSSCHPDFSAANHPQRKFRSKSHYQTKAALVCRHCHTDRQLKKSSIHATLLNEERSGTAAICTNCHGSHAVARITKKGGYADEEAFCMRCHGYSAKMSFRNGETLSGTVDLSSLQASVHNKASCSDCHYGFSSDAHPARSFSTRRDYTLASSENCRRCHFDKYTRTMESIHYTLLSQGNLKAPVCVDCHGSHAISHISRERALIAKRCQRCHAEIYEIYAKSVHGNALFNEHNQDVPVCADCHTAHTIKDPHSLDYRERVPEMCSNCHANEAIVGKYGLSVSVVDSYLSDFHGVTLKFYRLQKGALNRPARPMAVCTDCHGTHNINSTVGPNATIVKANLVKRCQKCHANASANFPDSWISHYKPSLARAPLVFLIMTGYKIFIPVLIAGLVLQIMLHIWRYVVDR